MCSMRHGPGLQLCVLEPSLWRGKHECGCGIQRRHAENLSPGLLRDGDEAATSSRDHHRHPLLCLRWAKSTLSLFCLSPSVFQKVFLPSSVTGHVILSAGEDGVVAVSSLADGAVTRVIEDHRGAPVTTIHCVNEQVSLHFLPVYTAIQLLF